MKFSLIITATAKLLQLNAETATEQVILGSLFQELDEPQTAVVKAECSSDRPPYKKCLGVTVAL